jgi:hypothetical protein
MKGLYLSFADKTGFLGGAFIPQTDIIEATHEAWQLGINPGGEVLAVGPIMLPPPEWVGRLLTKEEIAEFDHLFAS